MVEQEAVNFEVTGSSPVRGANQNNVQKNPFFANGFFSSYPSFPFVSVKFRNRKLIICRFSSSSELSEKSSGAGFTFCVIKSINPP